MTISAQLIGEIQSALANDLPVSMTLTALPPSPEGERFEVSHGDPQFGFVIRGEIGWKSLTLSFEPQAFSARMLEILKSSLRSDGSVASAVEDLRGMAVSAYALIDGVKLPLARLDADRRHVRTLQLLYEFGPLEFRDALQQIESRAISDYVGAFARSVARLLPLDVIDSLVGPGDELVGVPEGARSVVLVDRYERSMANREACIRHHGARCKVCGFDFGKAYGMSGAGLIEVHHIVPLSQVTSPRPIDPKNDLIPLCANCHLMAHRRTPPFSVEELKSMIGSTQ